MDIQKEKKKDKQHKILILLLLLLLILSLCMTIWALFFRESVPVLAPDYAPEIESSAKQLDSDSSTKLEAPPGGGAVSLTYSKDVSVNLSDKKIDLMFANPAKSTADMVLQLVIKDTVIMQSGRLLPGNKVTSLDLLDDAANQLAAGGYDGKFVVLYYDQQSGEKAMIHTEIPVTVTVTES